MFHLQKCHVETKLYRSLIFSANKQYQLNLRSSSKTNNFDDFICEENSMKNPKNLISSY